MPALLYGMEAWEKLPKAEIKQPVIYSGRLGDSYTSLGSQTQFFGAQKTFFEFSLFSCISIKTVLK